MIGSAEAPQNTAGSLERPDKRTILIVDDERSNLENYAAILDRSGYGVVTFDNAMAALAALRNGLHVDAVLTDYRMPDMNGMEFLAVLRREWRAVPVIMLTAHGDIDTYIRSFSLGLFEYVNKPFHEAELLRVIRAALGGRHGRREAHGTRT